MKSKKQLIEELAKIKRELKNIQVNNRKPYISLKHAQKKIRKVPTTVYKTSKGGTHIQCRMTLPACYANKRVRVIVVNTVNKSEAKRK